MAMYRRLCLQLLQLLLLSTIVHGEIRIHTQQNVTIDKAIDDVDAGFGPLAPDAGITGYAVPAEPAEACTAIAPPPNATELNGWSRVFIAIIRRSRRDGDVSVSNPNCTFDVKVLNAQAAGYDAVVVYNVDSDRIFEMSGGSQSPMVTIPSVFVGNTDGNLLINEYSYIHNYTITIYSNANAFDPSLYFLPFLVVAGTSFFILLVFVLVRTCRDRRKARHNRLTRADLRAFPTRKFRKGDPELVRYECCAICLEDYVDNDRLRILPCAHAYHARCVDEWLLTKKRVCPVCKQPIRTRREMREEARRGQQDSTSGNRLPGVGVAVHNADESAARQSHIEEDEGDTNEHTPLLSTESNEVYTQSVATEHQNAPEAGQGANDKVDDDDELLDEQTVQATRETLIEIDENAPTQSHDLLNLPAAGTGGELLGFTNDAFSQDVRLHLAAEPDAAVSGSAPRN